MNDVPLNTWIVKNFPTDFNLFESSFQYRILRRLSAFHYFRTSSDDVECNVLRDHYQTVCLAPEVLQTLSAMTSLKEVDTRLSPPSGWVRQKVRNRSVQEYNTRPLVDLNVAIPRTSSDAQAALTVFLGHLRDILEVCSL